MGDLCVGCRADAHDGWRFRVGWQRMEHQIDNGLSPGALLANLRSRQLVLDAGIVERIPV